MVEVVATHNVTDLQFDFHQYGKSKSFFTCDLHLQLSKTELFFPLPIFPLEVIPMCHFHARYLSLTDLIDM